MNELHIKITTQEELEIARENCAACDQEQELQIGDETWAIFYEGGQRGQMSAFENSGRGAICTGGDSEWGDWRDERLCLDNGGIVDRAGEYLSE